MLRFVNGLLLITALVGAYVSVRAGWEYQRLLADHRRLAATVGLLSVNDPDKAHFVAIDTGDPLHFAWQMYVPAHFDVRWKMRHTTGSGEGGAGGHPEPYFDVLRVRVRKEANERATMWVKELGASRMIRLSAGEFALLEGGQLAIEQLGTDGTAIVDRQQVVTLLQLSDPDASSQQPLLEIRFGTPQAFQAQLEQ
jgi:hypothetical protein